MNTFDHQILIYMSGQAFRVPAFDRFVNLVSGLYLTHLVLVAMLWWIWFRNGPTAQRDREIVISTICATFVSLFVGRSLAHWLPYRVRPFANAELGLQFPLVNPETHMLRTWSAFPSDHAMMFFALAVGIFMAARVLGVIAMAYTLTFICLPRVYLGLHHPTDILGGALLGALICVALTRPAVRRRLAAPVLGWSGRHEGVFYVGIFLLSFELACQFDELRTLSESLLKRL